MAAASSFSEILDSLPQKMASAIVDSNSGELKAGLLPNLDQFHAWR